MAEQGKRYTVELHQWKLFHSSKIGGYWISKQAGASLIKVKSRGLGDIDFRLLQNLDEPKHPRTKVTGKYMPDLIAVLEKSTREVLTFSSKVHIVMKSIKISFRIVGKGDRSQL